MTMTIQEVFDKVSVHLLTQNKRSIQDLTNLCQYRGPNACKCAVGVLIDDQYYNKKLEGRSVWEEDVVHALKLSGVVTTKDMLRLLWAVQRVHDKKDPVIWREELGKIASDFSLNTTAMDAVVAGAES